MANFTAGLVENLALVITKTSQSIEELKAMITSQNIVIEFLNSSISHTFYFIKKRKLIFRIG